MVARPLWLLVLAVGLSLLPRPVWAASRLGAPAGGAAIPLPQGKLACASSTQGWVAAGVSAIKPPTDQDTQIGALAELKVADSLADCAASKESVELVVTAPPPRLSGEVILDAESGYLEIAGRRLEGLRVGPAAGDQWVVCAPVDGKRACAAVVGRITDPLRKALTWRPAGATPDTVVHDASGRRLSTEALRLRPTEVRISRLIRGVARADVSRGPARLRLAHPQSATAAICAGAQCRLEGNEIVIDAVPSTLQQLEVTVTLAPRVRLDGKQEVPLTVEIVFCVVEPASGPGFRGLGSQTVVVSIAKSCGIEPEGLRFEINHRAADLVETVERDDDLLWALRSESSFGSHLEVHVRRPGFNGATLAIGRVPLVDPPRPRAVLTLEEGTVVDYVATNQPVRVDVVVPKLSGELRPRPAPGVYGVRHRAGSHWLIGKRAAAGFVTLTFDYVKPSLPAPLGTRSLAVLSEPLQRQVREADLPQPLAQTLDGHEPIVSLRCRDDDDDLVAIPPGRDVHIPFRHRDSCRLVLHRDRISPSHGTQRINIDIKVVSVAEAERTLGTFKEELKLRNGAQPRLIWIKGVEDHFDEIRVTASQIVDDDQEGKLTVPAATWRITVESALFRFYATATIPANLFRFSADPEELGTGPLALNFGVLSRLTWLTSEGKEGIFGLEAGVMAMGLSTEKDRSLNIVMGGGLGIPIANERQLVQASINIHAWAAYRLGPRTGSLASGDLVDLSPWAFVFGPSITVGSVGLDL